MKNTGKNYLLLLNNRQIYILTGILFLSAFPHFFNFPVFISLFFSLVLLFRIVFVTLLKKPTSRWVVFSFLILAFITVGVLGNSVGTGFGVSLLIVMLAMKTLELKSYRDAYVILFLCYFLLITVFLYNQEIYLWFYILGLSLAILAFLFSMNLSGSVFTTKLIYKNVAKISLQALPLMLVFFVVFPRLSGPLWAFKQDTASAVTGIGNSLSPGTISKLSQSNETAFRVKFSDPDNLPANPDRYWRGPVMTDTNGYEWFADKNRIKKELPKQSAVNAYQYQLTLEATGKQWLFALDIPTQIPAGSFLNSAFSVIADEAVTKRSSYLFESVTSYELLKDNPVEIENALFVPDIVTDRLDKFVISLQKNNNSPQLFINAVLDHFNKQNFIYTLEPPRLLNNPVDQFLFDSRKGFCEHYATSFVILMRLANIPARVVAGYQGGEWNPAGEHLIVRQSDAHAWAEVWLDNQGWIRIDPTSAVSPDRIEQSIDITQIKEGAPVVFRINGNSAFANFFRQASFMLDAIDLNWHRWVVGFSDKTQQRLFSFAGFKKYSDYLIILITLAVCILFIIFLTLFLKNSRRLKSDPVKVIWDKFFHKLIKKQVGNCFFIYKPALFKKR